MRGREIDSEKEGVREIESEKEEVRERKRDKEGGRERVFILKGISGALAPFSYLVGK